MPSSQRGTPISEGTHGYGTNRLTSKWSRRAHRFVRTCRRGARLIWTVRRTITTMTMPELDRNSTHLAGEYFVAAELYRRGYSVAMTLGNAKAIDLFAERGARTVNVQVKAIRNKRSIGWPIMKE